MTPIALWSNLEEGSVKTKINGLTRKGRTSQP